ncbi:MAG: DUF1799 domain-containing protein [Roseinatronobacter sp.]
MPPNGGADDATPVDDATADAARFGLSDDLCAALSQTLGDDNAVWRENVRSVLAFLSVSSQWRYASGNAGAVAMGLDYAGVRAGLKGFGAKVTPKLWGDLQVMEIAALTAMLEVRG